MPPHATSSTVRRTSATTSQRLWRGFCRMVVSVFYRRVEVAGREHVPPGGPLLLCANHANALVDALIVQAACPRPVHPLARSGLFRSPLLRPLLAFIQAVPVQRRRPPARPEAKGTPDTDNAADTDGATGNQGQQRNDDTFARCYSYLGAGRTILIFPEGQSHSDPTLRPIKTGAARLALGSLRANHEMPTILPVGLTFVEKGRFRSDLLVQFGPPIPFEPLATETLAAEAPATADGWADVEELTAAIARGLRDVTLDADSWEDVALVHRVEAFAAFRDGRRNRRRNHRGRPETRRRPALHHRYRAFQQLIDTHRALRAAYPARVAALRDKLQRFERLRQRYGVRDYHLDLEYRPWMVIRFVVRSLFFAITMFPIAAWGALNSALPYLAARHMSRRSARGRDQYDTASIVFGLLFFGLFWGAQVAAVAWWLGTRAAVYYGLSLPVSGLVALVVGRERKRIMENLRVFFLFTFTRRRRVRAYLRAKREEIVADLARLAQLARQRRSKD